MFQFTTYSKFYYIFSGALFVLAIVALILFGLKFGIEFIGGTNMQVDFQGGQRPSNEEIKNSLQSFNLGEIVVEPTGSSEDILRFKQVDEKTHQQILVKLQGDFNKDGREVTEKAFEYIGPSVGNELRNKTILALLLTLLAITFYIAFAFRKVSRPVSSLKYGLASLIALFHDVVIPVGVFAVLGKLYNVEITIPIIAAILTILGFSVHDTIIIFDRIRENIFRQGMSQFEDSVNASLNQTLGRSLSTSFTLLLVLVALLVFGGESLRYFALALIIGVVSGTYSSIFIAAPLLVTWYKLSLKKSR